MMAMQFGDNSWIRGLSGRPDLNGKHVVLREWRQDSQRWRCEPVGWKFDTKLISIRAKNLHNEPPPKASGPSPGVAAQLIRLVEREGELRLLANHSQEARLRHLLCQRELLRVQAAILSHREDSSLAAEAVNKLQAHERDLEPVQARWQAAGGAPVDIWETED